MQEKNYADDMDEFYFKHPNDKEEYEITEEQRKELKAIQNIIP
jgi:hypothetical protein